MSEPLSDERLHEMRNGVDDLLAWRLQLTASARLANARRRRRGKRWAVATFQDLYGRVEDEAGTVTWYTFKARNPRRAKQTARDLFVSSHPGATIASLDVSWKGQRVRPQQAKADATSNDGASQ